MTPEALLLLSVVTAEAAAAQAVARSGIIDSSALRICCLAGAAIGAVLAIAFPFESEAAKAKRIENGSELVALARKLLASAFGGVIFAPLLMRWFKIELEPDMVFGWSAVTAFASVTTLQIASNVYRRGIKRWLETKAAAIVGPIDEDESPSTPPSK